MNASVTERSEPTKGVAGRSGMSLTMMKRRGLRASVTKRSDLSDNDRDVCVSDKIRVELGELERKVN